LFQCVENKIRARGLGGLPRVGDVLQLQFYLGALGVEWGCLDYVDRGVLM
jgi:hypothetical protein